jgi:hypothetical protein
MTGRIRVNDGGVTSQRTPAMQGDRV